MYKILVGIPTFRRPQMLRSGLLALSNLSTELSVSVLVADNDPLEHQGMDTINRLRAEGYRWPIHGIGVAVRGISHARNAILDFGFAKSDFDYVVMMDDDQEPFPDWLDAIINKQLETSSHLVSSAIFAKFLLEPPQWAKTSKVYRSDVTTDGIVPMLTAHGGILVARAAVKLLPLPWYDGAFSLTGGEDTDLMNRLREKGAKFARSRDAKIFEVYAEDRMSLVWALKRAYRMGNAHIFVAIKSRGWFATFATEIFKALGAVVLLPLMLIAALGDQGKMTDSLCKSFRALGKMAAFVGSRYLGYEHTYGN